MLPLARTMGSILPGLSEGNTTPTPCAFCGVIILTVSHQADSVCKGFSSWHPENLGALSWLWPPTSPFPLVLCWLVPCTAYPALKGRTPSCRAHSTGQLGAEEICPAKGQHFSHPSPPLPLLCVASWHVTVARQGPLSTHLSRRIPAVAPRYSGVPPCFSLGTSLRAWFKQCSRLLPAAGGFEL